MNDPATTIDPSSREVLRRLELEITLRLDGLLHGDHRGLVPGHGSEQGETRRYAPGDDVRQIDWNVTARLADPHVRQTIAERELQTWLVIDGSARLNFGTARSQKRDLVLAGAAAVGYLTNRDGNQLGAMLASPTDTTIIPPGGSRRHQLRILHQITAMSAADRSGPTDLGAALSRMAALSRRRGLVVVISDFLVKPGWSESLAILARRNEVLAIQVTDPRDKELPNVGLVMLMDPATGQYREVATHKKKTRDAFASAATQRQSALEDALRTARAEHLILSTDRDWLDDLVHFVGERRKRLNTVSALRS